ncbi:MAG: hypothetical protein ACLPX5_08515 [Dissulfurispiraceae bacterium]
MTKTASIDKHWSKEYDSCVSCGSVQHPHKGKGYCKKCYRIHKHDIMPRGLCVRCGRTEKGYRNKETGDFICHSCRASRVEHCHVCKKAHKIRLRLGHGVRVCENCLESVTAGKCVHCGSNQMVIAVRGEPPVCPACMVRPLAMCSVCQSAVKYYKHGPEGNVLCNKCYAPPPKRCIICGRRRQPRKRVKKGHICVDCYEKPLRECAVCGQHKIGHLKTEDGKFLCRDCNYARLLKQELPSVESAFQSEWIKQMFLKYLDRKDKIQNAESVWKALKRDQPLFEKLGQHFDSPEKMTHELFWKHFHCMKRTRTGQLYAFLMEEGYLPVTNEPCDNYIKHHRILDNIESIHEGFRAPTMAYYDVLVTVRRKKLAAGWKRDEFGIGTYALMERTAQLLRKFAKAMTEAGLKSITEIAQEHVDEFVAGNLHHGGRIRQFMWWLHQEKYILWKYKSYWRPLKYRNPSKPIHDDAYDAFIDKFMYGSESLKNSLICLFALVYGIRVATMRKIKVHDIRDEGDKLFIKLPYIEIEVQKDIADKVRNFLHDTFIVNPFDLDNPYLFYGYTYKEPMEEDSIKKIFLKYGIRTAQIIPTAIKMLFDSGTRHPAAWMEILGIARKTASTYHTAYNTMVLEELNINRKLYGKIK